jgi:hypothetical protein
MTSQIRVLSRVASVTAIALALGFVATAPARAADDGQENFFSAVWGMVGGSVGIEKESAPPINYREHAPLVVPPNADLPAPGAPIAQREKSWPQDPELVEAKKKAEGAKAPPSQHRLDPPMTAAESRVRGGTPSSTPNSPADDCLASNSCNPNAIWSVLKNTKKENTQKLALKPGEEPPREYLTQPPPGYLSPTKAVKLTQSAPVAVDPDNNPENNPATYFRDQQQRQYSPQ